MGKRHGQAHTRTYNIWSKMIGRCRNVKDELHRKYYLERGITVCERWLKFDNWARITGRSVSTLHRRLNSGVFTDEQAVSASRYLKREAVHAN